VATSQTGTILFQRSRVSSVALVSQTKGTVRCESQRVASIASRHHAIEHVDSPRDPLEQIDRAANPHQVPRLVRGEGRGRDIQDAIHFFRRLADAQAADGVAIKTDLDQLLGALASQIGIEPPLDNRKLGLIFSNRGCLASSRPPDRSVHRIAKRLDRIGKRDHMIQDHGDVAAEFFLNADRIFRAQVNRRAIEMGFERRAVFGYAIHFAKRKDLKPAAVGQDRMAPSHEPMQSSKFRNQIAARTQREVIRVPEKNLRARRFDLIDREPLDGPLRADRHERRGLDHSVRQSQPTAPGGRRRIGFQEFERKRFRDGHPTILEEFGGSPTSVSRYPWRSATITRQAIVTVLRRKKLMVRFSRALSLALVSFVWAWIGCDSPKPARVTTPAAESKADAPKRTKVALLLNWYPEAEHGGFYAAQVHGIYEKYGLDVDIQPGGKTTVVAQSLALGRVQFGVANADDVLIARNQDLKLVALMAPIQDGPRCIMVRSDSGILSFEQLKNVTLQIDSARPYVPFLKSKGLLDDSVKLAPYFGSVAQLVAGPGYAAQGYNFSEPFMARQQGVEVNQLMMSEIGYNPYASLLVATSDYVSANEDICKRMVQASAEGWVKYLSDPGQSNEVILKANKQGLEKPALEFGVEALKPLCIKDGNAERVGQMSRERWKQLADTLVELKLIDRAKVDVDASFRAEFLDPSGK